MSPLSRASSEGFPKMGMGTHVLSFLISNHERRGIRPNICSYWYDSSMSDDSNEFLILYDPSFKNPSGVSVPVAPFSQAYDRK